MLRIGKSNLNDGISHWKPWRPEGLAQHFQMLKEKNCPPKVLYLGKLSFKNVGKIKTFSDEGKLREFVTRNLTLKGWLKEVL